ncbi:MAG TPA: hypothetical protein VFC78_15785 [Tepidisphaeraceae bacterium]|nr:hypothetical protein [Tepidisphaeraceae bacterium]
MIRLPVSRRCPDCGGAKYAAAPPRGILFYQHDRTCTGCGARYTPQASVGFAVIVIPFAIATAAAGAFSFALGLLAGDILYTATLLFLGLLLFWLGYSHIYAIFRSLRPTSSARGFAVVLPGDRLPAAPISEPGDALGTLRALRPSKTPRGFAVILPKATQSSGVTSDGDKAAGETRDGLP